MWGWLVGGWLVVAECHFHVKPIFWVELRLSWGCDNTLFMVNMPQNFYHLLLISLYELCYVAMLVSVCNSSSPIFQYYTERGVRVREKGWQYISYCMIYIIYQLYMIYKLLPGQFYFIYQLHMANIHQRQHSYEICRWFPQFVFTLQALESPNNNGL